jgi:hypothetical protein
MVKSLSPGGVAERLKAHVLKTCLGHTNVGSNPTPSARLIYPVVTALATVPVRHISMVATTKNWGGARVAEWARLLSECWVKPVAGSNPALPATRTASARVRFLFPVAGPRRGMLYPYGHDVQNPPSPQREKCVFNGRIFY